MTCGIWAQVLGLSHHSFMEYTTIQMVYSMSCTTPMEGQSLSLQALGDVNANMLPYALARHVKLEKKNLACEDTSHPSNIKTLTT